jgi:hypothetical protein
VWLAVAFALVREAIESIGGAARIAPLLLLVALVVWATFWNPRVEVTESGVRMVNVFRTIDIPWPAIQRIDTKWALTLVTAYGSFTAWAAPAPGMRSSARLSGNGGAGRRQVPSSAMMDSERIRPGDLPGSPSGDAAGSVRRHWEKLRDAGHLDNPRLEHERVPSRWNQPLIAAIAVLVIACVLAGLV